MSCCQGLRKGGVGWDLDVAIKSNRKDPGGDGNVSIKETLK